MHSNSFFYAAIQVGMALGPLLLPLICPTPSQVPRMLFTVSGLSTLAALPTFLIPPQPSIPPCLSATLERDSLWNGIRSISKHAQFWWLTLMTSVSIGMVLSVSVLIMEAIAPFGYSDQQAGVCAAAVVLAGCLGGVMSGYWLGKTAQYFMLLRLLTPMMVFSYVMFIFNFIPNAFATVLIACIINGFFSYALLPIYIELAAEITYPISESISSCLLWGFITIAMLIFSIVIDALRAGPEASPPNNMKLSMVVVAVIVGVGNLPCLWLKGKLNRLKEDQHKEQGFS
ncbi:hypothetical protein G6F57_003323 [Rhizopus arrhizus]|nr:hypothetical protein G6F24_005436 [Rhizopus arrhizus]KAG0790766.1 hypothetical protein G6F21_005568 [Rhizopus arrhizus]KAG0882636.1 hypothetical protein G6F15_006671 [Rhizopus arrhizus]KAG0967873.1 hypothetical protein G6F31_003377 [Rhizopus arrhizus]KAG1239383.1 hypothetical protein G6F35_000041 [Rhizopus arrhizus]